MIALRFMGYDLGCLLGLICPHLTCPCLHKTMAQKYAKFF